MKCLLNIKKNFLFLALVTVFIFFAGIGRVEAGAEFLLSPASGTYSVGDRFHVIVNIKTNGTAINAGVGQINFDNNRLEVESLQSALSIFSLWAEQPSFSNAKGIIKFSGGLPSPGFDGLSGNVFRILFRVKGEGDAYVRLFSGSILANDGKGTNIVDKLSGAMFTLLPGKSVSQIAPRARLSSPVEGDELVQMQKNIEAPLITTWPATLSVGDTLTIDGLGIPQSRILVYVQRGTDQIVPLSTYSGPDGRFQFTLPSPVKEGNYRVSARNEVSGEESGASEQVLVSVLPPPFLRVGSILFDYFSLVVTLFSLLIFVILLLASLWWRYRRWKRKEGYEISEAEHAVHKSFDTLKSGLRTYGHYLVGGKTVKTIKLREQNTKKDLEKGIDEIEADIEEKIRGLKK